MNETALATTKGGAIETIERGDSLMLKSPKAIQSAFDELRKVGNLIYPVASIGTVPALHAVTIRAVKIDLRDCYQDRHFCGQDEYALKGNGLNKLAAAAGANIVARVRLDDRTDPNYSEVEVTVAIKDFDGTVSEITKAKEMDLRDGSAETLQPEKTAKGEKTGKMVPLSALALSDKRRHKQSHAETKAYYRCLRSKLIIEQKYTKAELARPFFVPALVPDLDPSDPDQKRALIEQATMSVRQLYGKQKAEVRERRTLSGTFEPAILSAASTRPDEPLVPDPPAPEPEPDNPADFEEVALPAAPTPPADPIVCACPCGCQVELRPETATTTTDILGTPRCRVCFPGAAFDYAKHKDLRDLALPKRPGMNADDWKRGMAVKAAKK